MFVLRPAEFKANFLATSGTFEIGVRMSELPPSAPPDKPDRALGQVIRRLREERGLSRAELATRSGVDEATLAGIEAVTVDPPWPTVEALADSLGVSLEKIATAVVEQDAEAP